MTATVLDPNLDLLTEEYVLVQAWKKAASYIRQHNWYADTLELDRAAVDLPSFLNELRQQLSAPDSWTNDPLRIVPAPKSQRWHIHRQTGRWEPADEAPAKIRPLAHVTLKDQVAATALMLCLANRVESKQGDPIQSIITASSRKKVVSYGNRLFCDSENGQLFHRWGSTKLYRAYFTDYRTFIARPEVAAEEAQSDAKRIIIVHTDLKQFYDRVRPTFLLSSIERIRERDDDPRFYILLEKVLNWTWDPTDTDAVSRYSEQASLANFSEVALPQGLVAAGFFANVALLEFDSRARSCFTKAIGRGVYLYDACRYVDDLRIVVTTTNQTSLSDVRKIVLKWLKTLLLATAPELEFSEEKTLETEFRGNQRPLVRQSRRMERIQTAVSGGFDALGGEEILEAVQGLLRTQHRFTESRLDEQSWEMSPVPDVRDSTVARFAAGRFRTTYRSLRPMLEDAPAIGSGYEETLQDGAERSPSRSLRSKAELDDDVRSFALGLVENWVNDPSNVRLLRIGLDLWPSESLLENVLEILRRTLQDEEDSSGVKHVAEYCLSEIFRAGATETGLVEDKEALPEGIDLADYRKHLFKEGIGLLQAPALNLPWYLFQQIYLFLAATSPKKVPMKRVFRTAETAKYVELLQFFRKEFSNDDKAQFSIWAILARRSFLSKQRAIKLLPKGITKKHVQHIAQRDPSFALEVLEHLPNFKKELPRPMQYDLCLVQPKLEPGELSLANAVLNKGCLGPLRNELALLEFAEKFLVAWTTTWPEAVTPAQVILTVAEEDALALNIQSIHVAPSKISSKNCPYQPPEWCNQEERWRFQLGFLLRFILTWRADFTQQIRKPSWKEEAAVYRIPQSHWYQRRYGLYNGHAAFGDEWLPISDWVEKLLTALLAWPGCRSTDMTEALQGGVPSVRNLIHLRIEELKNLQGSASILTMPLSAPFFASQESFRICIVQTAVPSSDDFALKDLTLSKPAARRRHRNHLATALATVERMLDLRETHKGCRRRLDWLILPELAVHPEDVQRHLVPFARAHKSIILAGLTYTQLVPGDPLTNSAVWILPTFVPGHGLQLISRIQGKRHLAPSEARFNKTKPRVHSFRPSQWIVNYKWSDSSQDRPLRLTSSICYDATDLELAAALRGNSDIFAIPALNKDVNTFDQMALALHYHMYQMVIIANNGCFGGTNAYVPYRNQYERQVLHLHGQPQATVAFLEIDNISHFLNRTSTVLKKKAPLTSCDWKEPPAGF